MARSQTYFLTFYFHNSMLFPNSFIFKNLSFENQSVTKWRKSYQIVPVFYYIYAKINSRSAISFNP